MMTGNLSQGRNLRLQLVRKTLIKMELRRAILIRVEMTSVRILMHMKKRRTIFMERMIREKAERLMNGLDSSVLSLELLILHQLKWETSDLVMRS